LNQADDTAQFLKVCQNIATLKSKQEVSIRPILSKPFQSGTSHFGQTMKSCRNLTC